MIRRLLAAILDFVLGLTWEDLVIGVIWGIVVAAWCMAIIAAQK